MSNTLYLLATPIGNIKEANSLLIEKLETLPVLFCEDTRVTDKLLKLLKISNKPKLISYHKFNEKEKNESVLKYLEQSDCGLISDAGYPSISDPGHVIIAKCHEHQIDVKVVNGSCAVNHAVAQSGFATDGYIFIGFLPRTKKLIEDTLNKHFNSGLPIVFFESVHRINETLDILKSSFPDHTLYLGRELTKHFEEYRIDQVKNFNEVTEKGEFVLILKPHTLIKENNDLGITTDVLGHLDTLVQHQLKLKDACKIISAIYNLDAKILYNQYNKFKANRG